MSTREKIGIVGCGAIARAHALGWTKLNVELHCYSLEGAEAFADQFGATLHSSLEELIAAVDVVDVCTPTLAHPEAVHAALDAGKDVVCEKPLARDAESARRIHDHAREVDRTVFPAHVVRYFPEYSTAKAAIDRGEIGTPAVLRFERGGAMPTTPWFADDAVSGGIIMDQMIHDIDQALWIAGPARSVYAQEQRARAGDSEQDGGGALDASNSSSSLTKAFPADSAEVAVSAQAGGARVSARVAGPEVRTAHVTIHHESGAISHCRGYWGPPGAPFRYTFSIAGDAGRLEFDSTKNPSVVFDKVAEQRRASSTSYLPPVPSGPSPYMLELEDFLCSRRDGIAPGVSTEDGVHAVEVSLAALESIATGKAVKLS